MASLLSNISKIRSNMENEIIVLRSRVQKCETQGINNFSEIERCKKLINDNFKKIMLFDEKLVTMPSKSSMKKTEKIPYVFSAPVRNRYFIGRSEEMRELKRILKVEEAF